MLKNLFTRKNENFRKKVLMVHKYLLEDFERINKDTVDIPEFMKPKQERYTTKAWNIVRKAVKDNELDILYQKAVSAA